MGPAVAHSCSTAFVAAFAYLDPKEELFLCTELDTKARFWRNRVDTARFIRCNVSASNPITVHYCLGDAFHKVFEADKTTATLFVQPKKETING